MVDITLLEINLPEGTSLNASNLSSLVGGQKRKSKSDDSGSPSLEIGGISGKSGSGSSSDFDSGSESGLDADSDADSGSGGGKLVPLLGLLVLVGLAVAVRSLMGGSDEDIDELDELDDLSEMDVEAGK